MASESPLVLTNPGVHGRRRKHVGDETEAHAERLLRLCEPLAVIRRRTVPQKRDREGNTVFLARQGPDFEGMLLDGSARHVEIEVKRASGTSWKLDSLDEEQFSQLEQTWTHGGVAVVMVIHGAVLHRATTCMLPWTYVRERLRQWRLYACVRGQASVSAEDLGKYAVRANTPPLFVSWLFDEPCWIRLQEMAWSAAEKCPNPVRRAAWQQATRKVSAG